MRKMADCRRFESDNKCTLTIIGEEDEVIAAEDLVPNLALALFETFPEEQRS